MSPCRTRQRRALEIALLLPALAAAGPQIIKPPPPLEPVQVAPGVPSPVMPAPAPAAVAAPAPFAAPVAVPALPFSPGTSTRLIGLYTQPVRLTDGRVAIQIYAVVPGAPGAVAGLEPGDIIVTANGYLMQSHDNLRWIVSGSTGPLNLLIINARTRQYQSLIVPL
jgi:membrane-associated protease RseP (regulator of RpoE activity)